METLHKRWEDICLENQLPGSDKLAKTDAVRSWITIVNHARMSEQLSAESCCQLYMRQAEQYAEYVDSPEEEGGLNSYGTSALSLLSNKSTECQMWKSSLSLDCPDLAFLSTYRSVAKAAKAAELPPDRGNQAVFLVESVSSQYQTLDQVTASTSEGNSRESDQESRLQPCNLSTPHSLSTAQTHNLSTSQTRSLSTPHPLCTPVSLSVPHTHILPTPHNLSTAHNFMDIYKQHTATAESTAKSTRSDFGNFKKPESSNSFAARRTEPCKRSHVEVEEDIGEVKPGYGQFKTARQQLALNNQKAYGKNRGTSSQGNVTAYGSNKRSLGTRRGVNSKFVPPVMSAETEESSVTTLRRAEPHTEGPDEAVDERLKNIDKKMVELIMSEIMDQSQRVTWEDIAGLQFAKKTIQEIVVWPMLRPDIFTGLRGPPKGLLLFGPPGTGKTLIGKCVASQSKSTFFSISASSLTSKWVGEGEKMVRALFAVARVHQPAVVFIDEIDSLLSQRSDGEHESSRRIKTEFLVQLDGASTGEADRILVIGATNRPQELDEAARRRFVKRLYIPLPESEARCQIITNLMSEQKHQLDLTELQGIVDRSKGYSGADMANLCREAALGPIRSVPFGDIETMTAEQVRPILHKDFQDAFKQVRASVSERDLDLYIDWNRQYGSWDIQHSE